MTVDACAAKCAAAGLHVLSAETVGRQVCVTVKRVPASASGLAGLTARLGVGVTVSLGAGQTVIWFMAERQA